GTLACHQSFIVTRNSLWSCRMLFDGALCVEPCCVEDSQACPLFLSVVCCCSVAAYRLFIGIDRFATACNPYWFTANTACRRIFKLLSVFPDMVGAAESE